MKLACNYAIARFLPYAETGEFVSVGVALMCAEAGFFDFLVARKKRRVTQFFTELDTAIYTAGLKYFCEELTSLRDALQKKELKRGGGGFEKEYALGVFRELVKPRESIFRFSAARTVLADDPADYLKNLHSFYVERQFATKEYHENVMAKRLRVLFSQYNLARLYKTQSVGDETYSVSVPFVHQEGGRVLKAIKPLDLDQETSSNIYDHGALWIARLEKLKEIHHLPEEMLFAVESPSEGKERLNAYDAICGKLKALNAQVLPADDKAGVIAFAKVA